MLGNLAVAAGSARRASGINIRNKYIDPWYYSLTFSALFIYGLWISVGMLYYHYMNGWDLGTSFFFTLQVGLSVGFCAPVSLFQNEVLFMPLIYMHCRRLREPIEAVYLRYFTSSWAHL